MGRGTRYSIVLGMFAGAAMVTVIPKVVSSVNADEHSVIVKKTNEFIINVGAVALLGGSLAMMGVTIDKLVSLEKLVGECKTSQELPKTNFAVRLGRINADPVKVCKTCCNKN